MSREIKFRAWREDVVVTEPYGRDSFERKFMESDIDDIKTREFESFEEKGCVKAHRINIMQYIGINDKNGKEIYEGDIVRNFLCIDDHMDKLYEYGTVAYDEETLGFSVFDNENNKLSIVYMGNIEVIGNVYENADLLKEAE